MHWEMSLGSEGKGWTLAVKLKVVNDSLPICLEQRSTVVLNITNLFKISPKQYIVFCLDQKPI